jgi:hypothetical protein
VRGRHGVVSHAAMGMLRELADLTCCRRRSEAVQNQIFPVQTDKWTYCTSGPGFTPVATTAGSNQAARRPGGPDLRRLVQKFQLYAIIRRKSLKDKGFGASE